MRTRARARETAGVPALPATVEQARDLSWTQLNLVFATYFAGEVSAVMNGSGGALLRQRLAALSSDERGALREALNEPELA